jgi:protein TonB
MARAERAAGAGGLAGGGTASASVSAIGTAPPVREPDHTAAHLFNPPPAYPPLSHRRGEQGEVVVRVLVDPAGRARDGHLLASSGFPRLDEAGVQAALSWRYVPGSRDGQPVEMWVRVPVQFRLR